ncbi:MAG TPA: bifunctional UDP-N-acetylglucosamine diphosphorylase/glucosamine-1-phosphate N-acetyltransferase GlmU [Steroidobacteraceae bacterium]|jgi:bifunctional UDP-N-acetylglucosamine pyrophosphorylase/glucosamine-1-phosphate N-acetyltransferase|nr:bifunctional UDP-N-acetylglucosamine diphosphorylase/glucosamine-1-phosphate N-acetyltransferase GlmU [Steroidobacteraceae bacterium]
MKLAVVILAAGQGKRMKSDLPKVLQPLAGRPLLGHVVSRARGLEPTSMHVVYGHGGDQVQAAFRGEHLRWALQAEQLGTGHALMQAMPEVADDELVLVLYGDVPLIDVDTLRRLIALAGPTSLGLLTVMLEDPTGYGRIVRNARGAVQKIVEQRDASRAQLKIREGNSGILAAPAKLLRRWLGKLKNANAQGEYYLTDVIAMAVKDKIKVAPLVAPRLAEVLGVNDRAQLAELEALHRADRARQLMIAGATLADPARIDVRGDVTVGRDVFIDANVLFEGRVELGDRVRIGPNVVLRDARVGAGTVVHPNSILEQSEVGEGCLIGPYARLRPGSKLADQVHVGNFVELKKTELGHGSKANHLTYLGDAIVGKGVNIGAGTITCNYDGVNKSQTVIADGAFIGSGNMLVAPVRIGRDATTGAGSTISKDAPDGQLTLARSKQVTLEGWKRPAKKPKA